MKLAYLITAYDKPEHLNRLCTALHEDDDGVFVHIDAKSRSTFSLPDLPRLQHIADPIVVYWGGFSMVRAILKLLETAVKKDDHDYFLLLSGSDYPIRSNAAIHDYFTAHAGEECINISPMPENGKDWYRTDYPYFETDTTRALPSRVKNFTNGWIKRLGIKKHLPKQYSSYTLYGGSTWWALSRKAVEYILEFVRENPAFVSFYNYSFIPEELFFQTILGNSPFKPHLRNSVTYADWAIPDSPHPVYLNESHFAMLQKKTLPSTYGNKKMDPLFARKFGPGSETLLEMIDSKLR